MSGLWKTNQFLPLRVALATYIRVFTQSLKLVAIEDRFPPKEKQLVGDKGIYANR